MEKNPWRNWGILCQQGYMTRLKDHNGSKRESSSGTFRHTECDQHKDRCSHCNRLGHSSPACFKQAKDKKEGDKK